MIFLTRISRSCSQRERARWEHQAGIALLRYALSQRDPSLAALPEKALIETGAHGKPFLKGKKWHLSISHSGGIAGCALENCRVGLDLEMVRDFSLELAKRICTPEEWEWVQEHGDGNRTLTKLWTLKECYMKYTGLGLSQGSRTMEFDLFSQPPQLKGSALHFASADLGDAFLSRCSQNAFPLQMEWLSPEKLEPFFS